MTGKSFSNYYENSKFLPDTIDRTIKGILRKRIRRFCNVHNNDLNSVLNGIILKETRSFVKSYWNYLLNNSKWVRNYYMPWQDRNYYKANEQRCDRCGSFSPKKCYCEKCERADARREFSSFVKNKNFKEAMEVLLKEAKQ